MDPHLIGHVISYIVNTMPHPKDYMAEFIDEVTTYSFEPRKKGSPKNSGIVHELEDIVKFDIRNPRHLGKFTKKSLHFCYNKFTAKRIMGGLLDYLRKD